MFSPIGVSGRERSKAVQIAKLIPWILEASGGTSPKGCVLLSDLLQRTFPLKPDLTEGHDVDVVFAAMSAERHCGRRLSSKSTFEAPIFNLFRLPCFDSSKRCDGRVARPGRAEQTMFGSPFLDPSSYEVGRAAFEMGCPDNTRETEGTASAPSPHLPST